MDKLIKWLIKPLTEDIKLPVEIGDTVLMGRFKNKKVVVKSIDYNEKGDLLINGRSALKFRIEKKVEEAARVPRKKGQHRNSPNHSDLYTDENPKGTIKGLKFATVKDAQASVSKIKNSGKTHAHKIQAAVAMEQRAKEMGKKAQAGVYRKFINQMKKKTKKEMLNYPHYLKNVGNVPQNNPDGEHRYYDPKISKKKKKKTEMVGVVPSPSRKGINKMKKKGNTSVPYGSGYKKVNENKAQISAIHKFLTQYTKSAKKASAMINKNYRKVAKQFRGNSDRDLAVALIGYDAIGENKDLFKMYNQAMKMIPGSPKQKELIKKISSLRKKLKMDENIKKTLDLYSENDVYLGIENGDNMSITEQKIKKVVGIYGGRYQPFGPHHLKTYKWLKSKVDDAYITTSDIKQPPRHPMNYKEKVRHMVKMGVPANRIIKEKVPLKAQNVLKKYDPNTTAVIYIFGEKDAGRLGGGKKKSGGLSYFQDYNKNKNNLKGYEEHGYFMTAPHTSISVAGMEVSGTTMRKILGSPKIKDEDRPKVFKKLFGYYDKGVYNMMVNKFKKLFEFFNQPSVKKLVKEVSAFGNHFNAGDLSDEGLYDFFNSFGDYKRTSKRHADIIGYEVVGDILDDTARDPGFDYTYEADRVDTVTFGRTVNQNRSNTDSVANPFPKYRKHMKSIIDKMGWEIVKFFGKKTVKVNDSPTFDMKTSTQGVDKVKKIQESYLKDTKELLLMGGAYGHMSHPFDDNNLTFSDLKQIIINGLGGKLDREDGVTEKLDGQNLMVSWIDGKLKAARNKGHLKNRGETAPDTNGIKAIFSGRGNIEKAFVGAMKDLEKSIGKLSEKQKEKIFGNGTKWMNLEVMYPATANVIDYDVAEIVFHGSLEYNDTGKPIGQPKDSARMLQGMIKQVNANVQKNYTISKPNFLTVPKTQDFGKKKNYFLNKLKKLQAEFALKDSNRLGEYHEAFWREYVYNAAKQHNVSLKSDQLVKLVNRWAFFDKSYKIPDIKKDFENNPKFVDWVVSTDKQDHQRMFKDNIKPFEILFFEVGAEILKNISGFIAVSPNKAVQKIRKEVISALNQLKTPDKIEKLKKLKIQIEKLEAIGGLSAIVPSEGIVFKYKGNVYKFTGAFAPINQILGSLKFG
jgi:hypothetical protein